MAAAVGWSGCATGLGGSAFNTSGTKTRISGQAMSSTGGAVESWIQYGPTTSYGAETPHQTTLDTAPNFPIFINAQLTGLERGTTYHFRICAQDSQQTGGPGCGPDGTFTTPNLECGDTVAHDFTLSADVFCESFATPGLIVGAAGIDINLNGHTLRGPLMQFLDGGPLAIDNGAGHDDVTVRNGRLLSWGQMVEADGASFMAIRSIDASGNASGVEISGGESNSIRSAVMGAGRFGYGLLVDSSDGFVVADSSGRRWRVVGNGNRIVRNQISDGGAFETCLYVFGSNNHVADNTVGGCPAGSLMLAAGSNNTLLRNEVSGAWHDTLTGDDPDGIFVGAFTANTLLQGNFTHDNDDDGIDVRGTGTKLQDNRSDENGDLGIDAVAGVTDLGGNTAAGNGNPLQCRNVFCQ